MSSGKAIASNESSQALVKYTLHKPVSELDEQGDVIVRDAASEIMLEYIECSIPKWLSQIVTGIDSHLEQFSSVIEECRQHGYNFRDAFPLLCQQYESLLNERSTLFDACKANIDHLHTAQEHQFVQLQISSAQFADQVNAALVAAQKKDQEQFALLAQANEQLVQSNRRIMDVMQHYADKKEAEVQILREDQLTLEKKLSLLDKRMKNDKVKAALDKEEAVKDEEERMQRFFDLAIDKIKSNPNPIHLTYEVEELARSMRDGKSVDDLPTGVGSPTTYVPAGKLKGKLPTVAGPSTRPRKPTFTGSISPLDIELYKPGDTPPPPTRRVRELSGGKQGSDAGAGGGAGGGGRRGNAPADSPSDSSSSEDDKRPKKKAPRRSPSPSDDGSAACKRKSRLRTLTPTPPPKD